ncbi:MAG TPA: hypothetical protein DEV81_17810 [Cyanobacteria bacterium UBA11049]|nr:hypothetical protein [Cyanobacteria bacterium UBA11049]
MGLSQEQLQEFFNATDNDQDGKVDLAEFSGSRLRPLLDGLTNGKLFQKFESSDSISFEELKQLVQEAGYLG